MTKDELKEYRSQKSLTQFRLAQILHTTERNYVRWERGETAVPGLVGHCIKLMIERDGRDEKETA